MTITVAQMSRDELREMIEVTIEQKLLELLGDPDEGLEIRRSVHDRLLRQKESVAAGERGEPFEDVVRQLGEEENAQAVVEKGDLGYWPPGNAFCIFFGRTPASRGDEVRPASPVNVFGRWEGDPAIFKKVRSGEKVLLERVE